MAATGGAGAGAGPGPRVTISIPSQHTGNCASDTIQIVLFFADGYKEYFQELVKLISPYIKPGFAINTGDKFRDVIYYYIYYAVKRYISLGRVYPTSVHIVRSQSGNESIGPTCSIIIATISQILGISPIGSSSWAYSSDLYDTFTFYVLEGAKALGTAYGLRTIPPSMCFSKIYNNNCVAVQLFTFTQPPASAAAAPPVPLASAAPAPFVPKFHTFCLVKHDGTWCVGDNMLGFLVPLIHPLPPLPADLSNVRFAVKEIKFGAQSTREYEMRLTDGTTHIIATITRVITSYIGLYDELYMENTLAQDPYYIPRIYYYKDRSEAPVDIISPSAAAVAAVAAAAAAPAAVVAAAAAAAGAGGAPPAAAAPPPAAPAAAPAAPAAAPAAPAAAAKKAPRKRTKRRYRTRNRTRNRR